MPAGVRRAPGGRASRRTGTAREQTRRGRRRADRVGVAARPDPHAGPGHRSRPDHAPALGRGHALDTAGAGRRRSLGDSAHRGRRPRARPARPSGYARAVPERTRTGDRARDPARRSRTRRHAHRHRSHGDGRRAGGAAQRRRPPRRPRRGIPRAAPARPARSPRRDLRPPHALGHPHARRAGGPSALRPGLAAGRGRRAPGLARHGTRPAALPADAPAAPLRGVGRDGLRARQPRGAGFPAAQRQ